MCTQEVPLALAIAHTPRRGRAAEFSVATCSWRVTILCCRERLGLMGYLITRMNIVIGVTKTGAYWKYTPLGEEVEDN